MLLEDFLDFHGAKNNKDWYFYRELSAAIRHLSLGANFQKHLSNRLLFYDLSDYKDFKKDGEVTFDFLTQTLMKMAPIILEEARLHGFRMINSAMMIFRKSLPTTFFAMILMIRTKICRKRTS